MGTRSRSRIRQMRTCTFAAILFSALVLTSQAESIFAQGKRAVPGDATRAAANIQSTPGYAEVVLRRTEFEAELESLSLDYTDEFPKVKELKFALARAKAETDRLLAIPPPDHAKATAALGKLIVRKIDAETDVWRLIQNYADNHPEVKRAKRKVEIFEKAIKEILG